MYDGNEYALKCDIRSVAPVKNLIVTWSAGNKTLTTHTFYESTVTPVDVTATLDITADRELNGEVFKCEAELDLGPLEPEFQPAKQSLSTDLDVWCRSSPDVVFLAFYWQRLISVLSSFCCRCTSDPRVSRRTERSGAGVPLGDVALPR